MLGTMLLRILLKQSDKKKIIIRANVKFLYDYMLIYQLDY
jgi:hypothetical protein